MPSGSLFIIKLVQKGCILLSCSGSVKKQSLQTSQSCGADPSILDNISVRGRSRDHLKKHKKFNTKTVLLIVHFHVHPSLHMYGISIPLLSWIRYALSKILSMFSVKWLYTGSVWKNVASLTPFWSKIKYSPAPFNASVIRETAWSAIRGREPLSDWWPRGLRNQDTKSIRWRRLTQNILLGFY